MRILFVSRRAAPSFLVLGALLVGCGGGGDAGGGGGTPENACTGATPGAKGPGAFDASYATSKDFFTQMGHLTDGSSIHQATQIFYSCNLHDLVDQPMVDVPEGTVAIKRQGKKGSDTFDSLRVIIKLAKGTDPAHGDLGFEVRSADGKLDGNGGPDFCFGCHQAYASTGYLAGTSIRSP
ncbi:MAG TPA: hypothetical protein VHB21_10905 [Minicystis sp.]|nr:hypothetical protein [Minicystis sp.]